MSGHRREKDGSAMDYRCWISVGSQLNCSRKPRVVHLDRSRSLSRFSFSLFLSLFLSLSLHAPGCVYGVNETQSFKFALSNNLFNPTNRRSGPPTSVSRKDGGLFSFSFWFFMTISVTSFTQSSFPPLYAILGFRSMVYATICFVAVLVFGQSTSFIFVANLLRSTYSFFLPIIPTIPHYSVRSSRSLFCQSLRICRNHRY